MNLCDEFHSHVYVINLGMRIYMCIHIDGEFLNAKWWWFWWWPHVWKV